MNVELEALVREWHATLIDIAVAFSEVDDDVRRRALQRASGLATASQRWAALGLVRPVSHGPSLERHDNTQAIRRTQAALSRMKVLMEQRLPYLDEWVPTLYAGRKARESLMKRWQRTEGLHYEMRVESWRAFYVQMNALVPSAYACAVLRVEPQRNPHAYPEPALAVMRLHTAHVPAEYAASVLPQREFNREDAEVVVRLYNERVASELGAALL